MIALQRVMGVGMLVWYVDLVCLQELCASKEVMLRKLCA